MAETATRVPRAAEPAERRPKLLPAPEIDLRRAARLGLLGGLTAAFVSAIGMVQAFLSTEIVQRLTFSYVLLAAIPVVFGYLAGRPPPQLEGFEQPRPGARNAVAGAIAGVLEGAALGAFTALIATFDVRHVFTRVSPELVEALTLSRGLGTAIALHVLAGAVLAALGGASHLLAPRWRKPLGMASLWVLAFGLLEALVVTLIDGIDIDPMIDVLYAPAGGLTVVGSVLVAVAFFALYAWLGRERQSLRERLESLPETRRRTVTIAGLAALIAVLVVLPSILGVFLSQVAVTAGIFLLMALGLNIVVGFAGLLDLGYVAFFAVGAYTTAVLTSSSSPAFAPELTFWLALPVVVLAAAVAGMLVGAPVIRMRGDYLAIVTLGFGEIARLLFLSEWLTPVFGGAQGIINVPNIVIGPVEVQGPQMFFYAVFGFALIAAYVSYAVQDSRIGRAWMAMREDESVAEAMGVNIISAKLSAFIIGAILAGFGGALFATNIGSIFPHSFNIIVSITVLVVIIIGGLGSIPGVVVGALVLVGLPDLLREFEDFRFLIYGALLIFMMLNRPEGFIPSRRRAQELHEEEAMQDAWLREEQRKQERAESAPPGA
jgi:branched-chain amino acid transport system permease protein